MIGYIIMGIILVGTLLFVGREVAGDICNPHKGQVNEENSWKNVPKIKTRSMYSQIER